MRSGDFKLMKQMDQHHPLSTKIFKKTFELTDNLNATTSGDVPVDSADLGKIPDCMQNGERRCDFLGFSEQMPLSQMRALNPLTFESEDENQHQMALCANTTKILQMVEEDIDSSGSEETTEGMVSNSVILYL
jgi:hypothetical protein